jgi:pilus assembly protein FimV
MNPKLLLKSALVAVLFSGNAMAVGFGEIVLLSRIGEPLRAEVPIIADAGEGVEAACFSLAGIRNTDLPVVSSGRFRLNRNGTSLTLSITGTHPISEPIFVIGLRAHCGIELQRDYILMPPPPVLLAESQMAVPTARTGPVSPTIGKARNFREFASRRGDTLASIAEAQSGGNLAEQQRLLAAMKRANPDLMEYEALADGRSVRIPILSPRTAENSVRTLAASPADDAPPPQRPKKQPTPQPKSATPPVSGTDRIVLGAAPDEIRPEAKPSNTKVTASEVEERMLKLETTLNLLNLEVEKLNSALALTTKALVAQQGLMTAQGHTHASDSAELRVAPPPPRSSETTGSNWPELLLSALIGGGMAAGLAHFISRRNRTSTDELRLSTIAQAAPPPAIKDNQQPDPIPTPATLEPPPASPVAAIPLDAATAADDNSTAVNVDFNDGNSALELAEIMLSFGRIRGAAETLAMHIEENSPDNIQPWAMLLDLYRRADMPGEFESLAAAMRGRFNVRVLSWDESTAPVSGLKSLEDYAHIIWRITNCWGKQECMDYLNELVHDNRAGNRSGFPLEVIEEIILLMRTLEEGYSLRRDPA